MRRSISYRVRAIALVALLTSATIAVTAWVTARSTVTQLSNSVQSQQDDVDMIANQITNYGILHGVWVGIPPLLLLLERETSQRIKLTTQDGEVVVDTDTLDRRTARPISDASPVAIVPRPVLDLSRTDAKNAYVETLAAIRTYRDNVRVDACLTQKNVPVSSTAPVDGIGRVSYDRAAAAVVGCPDRGPRSAELSADVAAVKPCAVVAGVPSKPAAPFRPVTRGNV
jgi:hypothetical protein